MAITVGALQLDILTAGLPAALSDVKKLDEAAAAVGAKPTEVKLAATGASDVGAVLAATEARAISAGSTIGKSLGGAFSGVANAAKAALPVIGSLLTLVGGFAAAAGIGVIASSIGSAIDASNRLATSFRILDSTSRITGVPLAFLQRTSDELSKSLGTTATVTNSMVATAVRFTSAAGRVNDTGTFLTRWLDLASSRGLTAAEAMGKLQTTLEGQDEGLNAIGLANPSDIYKKWADAVGGTAGKLSDAQQKQAIVNEVMAQGAKVAGAYASQMDGAQGAVIRLDNAKQNFLVTLGQAITGTSDYGSTVGAMTAVVNRATEFVSAHRGAISGLVADLAILASAGATLIGWLATTVDLLGKATSLMGRFNLLRSIVDPLGAARAAAGLDGAKDAAPTGRVDTSAIAAFNQTSAAGPFGSAANPFGGGTANDFGDMDLSQFRSLQTGAAAAEETAKQKRAREAAARKAEADRKRAEAAGKREERTDFADERYAQSQREPVRFALDSSDPVFPKALDTIIQSRLVALPVRLRPMITNVSEATRALQQRLNTFANAVGETIARSISAGFGAALRTAFSGGGVLKAIGDGFKVMASGMLSGLGSALVMFGEQALIATSLMAALKKSLIDWSPAAGIGVSLGIIALGSLLQAAGSSFGGMGGGGGGGGGRGGSSSYSGPGASLDSSYTLSPRAAPVGGQQAPTGRSDSLTTQRPFVYAPTIIGQNDPIAQRQIANMVAKAANRGIGS